jgi:hypothetical protein
MHSARARGRGGSGGYQECRIATAMAAPAAARASYMAASPQIRASPGCTGASYCASSLQERPNPARPTRASQTAASPLRRPHPAPTTPRTAQRRHCDGRTRRRPRREQGSVATAMAASIADISLSTQRRHCDGRTRRRQRLEQGSVATATAAPGCAGAASTQ